MKKDAFFGFLGRANSVLLFLCGMGFLGLLGFGFYSERESSGPHGSPRSGGSSDARESLIELPLELGTFNATEGTSWVYAPQELTSLGPRGEKGKTRRETVNYIFLDMDTGATRWLRPGQGCCVEILDKGFGFGNSWANPPVHFLMYRVKERDTTGDGEIDDRDQSDLAISKIDGSGFRVIVENFGWISFLREDDTGNVVLLHQWRGEYWRAEIDPETLGLIRNDRIDVGQKDELDN